MNNLIRNWILFLGLITVVSSSLANTITQPENISVDEALQSAVAAATDHRIEMHSVQIPEFLISRPAAQALKVGNHHGGVLNLKTIQLLGDQVVVVGQRVVTKPVRHQHQSSFWLQEVRVTFPRAYLASSWDVLSLQRELERLGIKIKPKPAVPKPTQQLSG